MELVVNNSPQTDSDESDPMATHETVNQNQGRGPQETQHQDQRQMRAEITSQDKNQQRVGFQQTPTSRQWQPDHSNLSVNSNNAFFNAQ